MISICFPTRGRPSNVVDLVTSVRTTAKNPVEIVFYVDDDDTVMGAGKLPISECRVVRGPRIRLSDTYNRCAEMATGEILMGCCDAVVFKTPGWDEMVEEAFVQVDDKILLVYGNDEIHRGGMATLPFIHRRWVETIGRFYPPYFAADWCDTWVFEVAQMIGRCRYLPDLVTQHRHPIAGTAPMDETWSENEARKTPELVELWRSTAAERRVEAEKLRAVMR